MQKILDWSKNNVFRMKARMLHATRRNVRGSLEQGIIMLVVSMVRVMRS